MNAATKLYRRDSISNLDQIGTSNFFEAATSQRCQGKNLAKLHFYAVDEAVANTYSGEVLSVFELGNCNLVDFRCAATRKQYMGAFMAIGHAQKRAKRSVADFYTRTAKTKKEKAYAEKLADDARSFNAREWMLKGSYKWWAQELSDFGMGLVMREFLTENGFDGYITEEHTQGHVTVCLLDCAKLITKSIN
jgi:hypothetical protein